MNGQRGHKRLVQGRIPNLRSWEDGFIVPHFSVILSRSVTKHIKPEKISSLNVAEVLSLSMRLCMWAWVTCTTSADREHPGSAGAAWPSSNEMDCLSCFCPIWKEAACWAKRNRKEEKEEVKMHIQHYILLPQTVYTHLPFHVALRKARSRSSTPPWPFMERQGAQTGCRPERTHVARNYTEWVGRKRRSWGGGGFQSGLNKKGR